MVRAETKEAEDMREVGGRGKMETRNLLEEPTEEMDWMETTVVQEEERGLERTFTPTPSTSGVWPQVREDRTMKGGGPGVAGSSWTV